jgi:hypothetical protein
MDQSTSPPYWTPPPVPTWNPFQIATKRLIDDFDVINRLVEETEHGEELLERMIDDLLCNFAERWIAGKTVPIDVLCDFFVSAFDDHFDAEVEDSVVYPLSKVLHTIYEECRHGVLKGAQYIVSKPSTRTAPRRQFHKEEEDDGEEEGEETNNKKK